MEPLDRPPALTDAIAALPEAAPEPPARLLVVDDERSIVDILNEFLVFQGHAVTVASTFLIRSPSGMLFGGGVRLRRECVRMVVEIDGPFAH